MATFEETIEKAVQAESGAFVNTHNGGSHIGANAWSGTRGNGFTFDASRSSAIYGKSTTVQPPAYALIAWRRTA